MRTGRRRSWRRRGREEVRGAGGGGEGGLGKEGEGFRVNSLDYFVIYM